MTSRLSLFLLVCVFSGTLFFLFSNAPEARTFSFSDGALTVTAFANADAWLEAQVNNDVYTLRSSFIPKQPAKLRVKTTVSTNRLAYFDASFGMWRPVETLFDPASNELLTSTTELNTRWTHVPAEVVARPNLQNETAALLAAPPVGAVGYALEMGFSDGLNLPVIMEGMGQSGGCAGKYRSTADTTLTSTEVLFSEALRYQVVAVWQLADGCEGREVIEEPTCRQAGSCG